MRECGFAQPSRALKPRLSLTWTHARLSDHHSWISSHLLLGNLVHFARTAVTPHDPRLAFHAEISASHRRYKVSQQRGVPRARATVVHIGALAAAAFNIVT